MSNTITFLPWVRRGLGLGLSTSEDLELESQPRASEFEAHITIDGTRISRNLKIRPPDHVASIELSQISRRYPSPNTTEAEFGFFPHIEFLAPDLPWTVSPRSADEESGRLRPWIVLICVPEASAQLKPNPRGHGQLLTVDPVHLFDLTDSYAWAHVQTTTTVADIEENLHTGATVSRILCPLELMPHTRYRTALVNAWKSVNDQLHPAWDRTETSVTLTVYDTWTFATGQVGSFEELVGRLSPVEDKALTLGIHPVDITDLGLISPWSEGPVRCYYRGAMADALFEDRLLKDEQRDSFVLHTKNLISLGQLRHVLRVKDPDPVVSPPLYGSGYLKKAALDRESWLSQLNLSPSNRMAAGLGATLIRKHQERLMAVAWDQAGQAREANRLRSDAQLRQTLSDTHLMRTAQLLPHQRISVLGPQMTFVRVDGRPVKELLRTSDIPNGLHTPAMMRALRPSGIIARSYTAPLRRQPAPDTEPFDYGFRTKINDNIAIVFDAPEDRSILGLSKPRTPGGIRLDDPRRSGEVLPDQSLFPSGPNYTELANDAISQIVPRQIGQRHLTARVPALAAHPGDTKDGLPGPAITGPVFTEPVSQMLMGLSPELVLPGVTSFPDNAICFLSGDSSFLAALMVGANHEMQRELMWREFPISANHTSFRRFWPRPKPDDTDIQPVHQWALETPLNEHGMSQGESAILLVRGDVVRQFPAVRFFLLKPGDSKPKLPEFSGVIPPDMAFFGFDVPQEQVFTTNSPWMVIIEEPAHEPRFGLDTGPVKDPLRSYADLKWGHLPRDQGRHLSLSEGESFVSNSTLGTEATWGINGAHMAKITHQKPFRLRIPVSRLLGEV